MKMMATALRLVLILLLGSRCALAEEVTGSCMVRLFTTAGLSLSKATETEKNLVKVGLSLKDFTRTVPQVLSFLLKTTADESSAISNCIRRKSDACKRLNLCEHGGRCLLEDSAHAYTCQCKGHFKGSFCEKFDGIAGEVQVLGGRVNRVLDEVRGFKKEWRTAMDYLTGLVKKNFNMPRSCQDIKKRQPRSPSGLYDIQTRSGGHVKVYCEMEREGGGWTRVLHLDPAKTGTCPGDLRLINPGRKVCTKLAPQDCSGITVSSPIFYSQIMGYATGYKDKTLDAFAPGRTIDHGYVDGVSITRGSPRQHVWSYAGGFRDISAKYHCPCSVQPGPKLLYVGDHYYCNDHNAASARWSLDASNHMWSSESKCAHGSRCCQNKNMPWFVRTLGDPTNDKIQYRVCCDERADNENIGIDKSEIYVR